MSFPNRGTGCLDYVDRFFTVKRCCCMEGSILFGCVVYTLIYVMADIVGIFFILCWFALSEKENRLIDLGETEVQIGVLIALADIAMIVFVVRGGEILRPNLDQPESMFLPSSFRIKLLAASRIVWLVYFGVLLYLNPFKGKSESELMPKWTFSIASVGFFYGYPGFIYYTLGRMVDGGLV